MTSPSTFIGAKDVVIQICLLLICSYSLHSQVIPNYDRDSEPDYSLIPVHREDLMGFVDRNNNVIIEPAFQAVSFFNKAGLALAKKDGMTGIIDRKGAFVLQPLASRLSLQSVFNDIGEDGLPKPFEGIYYLYDAASETWTLFAPAARKKNSGIYKIQRPPFENRMHYSSRSNVSNDRFRFGYKKIEKENGKVNFIDTTFTEILPYDVVNGMPVDKGLFMILNEKGKAALCTPDGTQITGYTYSNIEYSGLPGYYIARAREGMSMEECQGLIDRQGKLIFDTTYAHLNHLRGDHFGAMYQRGMGVLDLQKKQIVPFEYENITSPFEGLYVAYKASTYVILNSSGQLISGPYPNLTVRETYGYMTSLSNDTTSFINNTGKVIFRKKGKLTVSGSGHSGIVCTGNKTRGLLDSKGNVILDTIYQSIEFIAISDAVKVNNGERNAGLYSKKKGWIHPCDGKVKLMLFSAADKTKPDNVLQVITARQNYIYTNSLDNVVIEQNKGVISETRIGQTMDTLCLDNHRKYPYPKDQNLSSRTNGEVVFFEKKEQGKRVILDAQLKPILPAGYNVHTVYETSDSYVFGITAKDGINGLYGLNKQWLLGPEALVSVERPGDHLWLYGRKDERQLYNAAFKKLSDRKYASVFVKSQKYIEAKHPGSDKIDVYSVKGTLLNEGMYSDILSAKGAYVTVQKSEDGAVQSCLTDTLLREIKCFNYKDVYVPFDDDNVMMARDLYDYGLIRMDGSVLMPFQYRMIEYYPEIAAYRLDKGNSMYDFITEDGRKILSDVNGFMQANNLMDRYWTFKSNDMIYVFNKQTKKHLTIPTELGYIRGDEELMKANLLTIVKDRYTTYVDAEKGIVYK